MSEVLIIKNEGRFVNKVESENELFRYALKEIAKIAHSMRHHHEKFEEISDIALFALGEEEK